MQIMAFQRGQTEAEVSIDSQTSKLALNPKFISCTLQGCNKRTTHFIHHYVLLIVKKKLNIRRFKYSLLFCLCIKSSLSSTCLLLSIAKTYKHQSPQLALLKYLQYNYTAKLKEKTTTTTHHNSA